MEEIEGEISMDFEKDDDEYEQAAKEYRKQKIDVVRKRQKKVEKVLANRKRAAFIQRTAVSIVAVGASALIGKTLVENLPKGEDAKSEHRKTEYISNINKKEFTANIPEDLTRKLDGGITEKDNVLSEIIEQYQKQYPELTIKIDDLSIIESFPSKLIKQKNEDGSITYIEEENRRGELLNNQKLIWNGMDTQAQDKELFSTNGNYIVVDDNNNTIIYALGYIDHKIVDIEAKYVRSLTTGKEYKATKQTLKMDFESDAKKANMYIDLKNKFQELLQTKTKKNMNKGFEIGD